MNVVLLEPADFVGESKVLLRGRRSRHIESVLGAVRGDMIRIGIVNGRLGQAVVERAGYGEVELSLTLDGDPPAALPLRLVLALPRPKVLNRTIAAAVTLGIREIDLINAWRVEKAYWKSPKLQPDNLRQQAILGLEQAGDTVLPSIRIHRFFSRFVRDEVAAIGERCKLLADPGGSESWPAPVTHPFVLAVGPEGGFIEREIATLQDAGFLALSMGPRILRVETAIACLVGRLFPTGIASS